VLLKESAILEFSSSSSPPSPLQTRLYLFPKSGKKSDNLEKLGVVVLCSSEALEQEIQLEAKLA